MYTYICPNSTYDVCVCVCVCVTACERVKQVISKKKAIVLTKWSLNNYATSLYTLQPDWET